MTDPEHWEEELLHDQFRHLTENATPAKHTLRGLLRSLLDLPRGSMHMAHLFYEYSATVPAESMKAAYAELDAPGRTPTEIALILEHRLTEHGNPFQPASDEVM